MHDIRQLSNLIWKANINFIEVLFSKEVKRYYGLDFLFENREKWAAMNLYGFKNATYGMHLHKMSDLHKGTAKTKPLVEKYGYDTKEACHALRCLYVLEKYADTNSMEKTLWFNEGKRRDTLLQVKAGHFTENEFRGIVDHWITHVWGELEKAYNDTRPDMIAKEELDNSMLHYVKDRILEEEK